MIEVHELTKRYGKKTVVDNLSFAVQPGVITGFLGPNGAGKSTTMRMILGLDRPTSGVAMVNGKRFVTSRAPLHEIGALLDAKAVDKKRSARNHLRAMAASLGIGNDQVDGLLEAVGLAHVAKRPVKSFSLGMSQRLGIAAALLGNPEVVMLDEPVNGLDPDGIRWIRELLTGLARDGRTVFLSSHLMSEMQLTAEHLIIIGRGRLLADISMSAFIASATRDSVRVVTPQAPMLEQLLAPAGVLITTVSPTELHVEGVTSAEIGRLAAEHRIELHQLTPITPSLEEAFMELTHDEAEYANRSAAQTLVTSQGPRA